MKIKYENLSTSLKIAVWMAYISAGWYLFWILVGMVIGAMDSGVI